MDFLDALLNNIDEAIIITDPSGKILFFNEPAQNQFFPLQRLRPLRVGEFLPNVGSARQRKALHRIIKDINLKKQIEKSFAEYSNHQGATVYLDLNYIPILNDENELTHIYIFSRDITPQKVYERKLTTQTVNMSNLIEQASAVIIGVDMLGYITDWNEHCAAMTGFTKIEAYASKLSDLVGADEHVLRGDNKMTHEITFRTKAGQILTLLLSSTPRTTAKGEVIGYTLVGQDITELIGYRKSLELKVDERTRQVQDALKKEKDAVDLKSRFVSTTSHELRSPLSTIQYAADFIRIHGSKINPVELTKKAEAIDRQVMHMTHLLDDLLLFSKADSGNFRVVLEDIPLRQFLDEVVEEVKLNTRQTHSIVSDFYKIPTTLVSDEKLLRNITINLLTNAIKYSPGKDYVEFSVRQYDDDIILIVRDYGLGIGDLDAETLFEPFLRGASVSNIPGTGLGLSIVKKAVELLKGTITFTTKVDEGSTFTVTLPANV
ncbi:MAG: PAS domain-containing sensor histidine kinase, partial [Chryseolinea sp.]